MNEPCPACGKLMVREYDQAVLLSNPPTFAYRWWCGCGHRGEWVAYREPTAEERLRATWEMVNSQGDPL